MQSHVIQFIITAALRARWARLRELKHPWIVNALKKGLSLALRDTSRGEWAALCYQITGDVRYVAVCLAYLKRELEILTLGNRTRYHLASWVVCFDWIREALSDEDERWVYDHLRALCVLKANKKSVAWGDVDDITGHYGAILLMDLCRPPGVDPAAWVPTFELLNTPRIGGLQGTGRPGRTNFRDAVRDFWGVLAEGGVSPSGADYHPDDTSQMVEWVLAARTALGYDAFPEISARFPEFSRYVACSLTRDWKHRVQWADCDKPRQLDLLKLMTLAGMVSGLEGGGNAQYAVQRLVATHGPGRTLPLWRALLTYSPDIPAVPPPLEHFVPAQGLLMSATPRSMHVVHAPPDTKVHHQAWNCWGNFCSWIAGSVADQEAVLQHPLGVGKLPAETFNCLMLHGFSPVEERRAFTGHLSGETDGVQWWRSFVTCGGKLRPGLRAPEYIARHDRSLTFAEWPGGLVVVVRDHLVGGRDILPAELGAYTDEERAIYAARGAANLPPVTWIVHAPASASPSVSGNAAVWHTPRGQRVRVELWPTPVKLECIDERVAGYLGTLSLPDPGKPMPSELGWRIQAGYPWSANDLRAIIHVGAPPPTEALPEWLYNAPASPVGA